MSPEEQRLQAQAEAYRSKLNERIDKYYEWYGAASRKWGIIYHWSLYFSAALSAYAALSLKLDFLKSTSYQNDFPALLAGTAAVLTTIVASGGLDRRYRIFRASRGSVEKLRVEILKPDADLNAINSKLQEIIQKNTEAITGEKNKD
ncbi:MAG: hypothetical protein M3247_03930 [Thermoproteota archaeon]|nr:hypothetical protein [Acidobacteriota bacterium]MDQ3902791.1 hypothetical protein [Thermoproteota archaeon]